MTSAAIIIPFRDRGADPLRQANLNRVLAHWGHYDTPVHIVTDGRAGDAPFNRSAAYNRGTAETDAEILIYTESDMLITYDQINDAVDLAAAAPGLVIPFTEYRYLAPDDSDLVRRELTHPGDCYPQSTMDNGASIGAINILSRRTLAAVGQWDEHFQGSWYDDRAMKIAFDRCAGPTRWVKGPAYHLYHRPGWKGDHLTDADLAATAANKARLCEYRRARTPTQIRQLTTGQ